MNTENEKRNGNGEVEHAPDGGVIPVSEQTVRDVLALYGDPKSFGTDKTFGGWKWWELIDLMENPAKASRTKPGCCTPAVAKLFTALPGVRAQLENMRQAAVEKMQASIRSRIIDLIKKWMSGPSEYRDGTSYQVLGTYNDDNFTIKWLEFLKGSLPHGKLYEMGIYICNLPDEDCQTVQTFTMNCLREVPVETLQGWMSMPCVVVTGVESRYYPSGLKNPENCERVSTERDDAQNIDGSRFDAVGIH